MQPNPITSMTQDAGSGTATALAMWMDCTEFSFQAPDRLQPGATPTAA